MGGDRLVFLGPTSGCWSPQPCLITPICYSAEQTSASADAGCTSPLHLQETAQSPGTGTSQKGIPRVEQEPARLGTCPAFAHMAQLYADLRFAKVMGGRSMASQALEAGENPLAPPHCPCHAQPHGLSYSPLPSSNSLWHERGREPLREHAASTGRAG